MPPRKLQRAAGELDPCGALRYRDDVERELRKLGHRIHRRMRPGKADGTGIESLTARELQVARLVVDRKTNPEIAAEFMSAVEPVQTIGQTGRKSGALLVFYFDNLSDVHQTSTTLSSSVTSSPLQSADPPRQVALSDSSGLERTSVHHS